MRLWPFQTERDDLVGINGAALDRIGVVEDLLRRNVEDVFRVERQEARGGSYGWGGTLLVAAARALPPLPPPRRAGRPAVAPRGAARRGRRARPLRPQSGAVRADGALHPGRGLPGHGLLPLRDLQPAPAADAPARGPALRGDPAAD